MRDYRLVVLIAVYLLFYLPAPAQEFRLSSPDSTISLFFENSADLSYSVHHLGQTVLEPSRLGFEFLNEEAMDSGFVVLEHSEKLVDESWKPVVSSKHSLVRDHYNELRVSLQEGSGRMRKMDLFFRAYNDGVAFRYRLYRGEGIGFRKISTELTTFNIPGNPNAWIAEYGGYATSNESEFKPGKLSDIEVETLAAMPLLLEYGTDRWVAITEANIENYAAFYLGSTGASGELTTRLVPAFGEDEGGEKVRFADELLSPWRVLMIGSSPGTLIESELIRNLNEPCAIEDPSWIQPGMCAWDHWWSGDVKMEMPVIREYIDLASEMGWSYMLVDWQWYGPFNSARADITRWAPQIDMPGILAYAREKNVKIILWLYSTDVNRNSAYKEAFPLYHDWGVAGVKIDFMDREDQEMVRWYHDIIQCAAENELLVNFHGAYKPDGIMRTYPNMITREGVMGNEYYKFSYRMNPEHNVSLAFTRMLAGQMDYTPGGFKNVTREQFKLQTPALVSNTRAAELSKFVVYESPLTIVCDHPDHIRGQTGSDFLKEVPTVWDDISFLGGYPGEYVAIAKRSGDLWFLGVLNNSVARKVELKLDFLPEGRYEMEAWADGRDAERDATQVKKSLKQLSGQGRIKVDMANNGGFVGIIRAKK